MDLKSDGKGFWNWGHWVDRIYTTVFLRYPGVPPYHPNGEFDFYNNWHWVAREKDDESNREGK